MTKLDELESLLKQKLQNDTSAEFDQKMQKHFKQLTAHSHQPTDWLIKFKYYFAYPLTIIFCLIVGLKLIYPPKQDLQTTDIKFIIKNSELLENVQLLSLVDDINLSEEEWSIILNDKNI